MTTKGHHSPSANRILYIDNLRLYLISLVVLHHVAVGYGGSGDWPIRETPDDGLSPILFFLFNAINQSYFMSFFYLLSGYFLPRSYDKKGPGKCLKDRLSRLGIPLLAYIVFIAPLVRYVVVKIAEGKNISFAGIIAHFIEHRIIDVGPLWFVEGLLIFSVIYILFRVIKDRFKPDLSFNPFKDTFPNNRAIVLSIIAIALATFAVRIWFPLGVIVYHFQLAHFVHYAFCFCLGILAYRGRWFENLSGSQAKLWGRSALVTICFLPTVITFSIVEGGGPEDFAGGLSWVAFSAAAWESIACLSIIIALLYIFQKRFNSQGKLLLSLSPNAYTVYIDHVLVITTIMALFIHTAMPTAIKFLFVSIIGLPSCFIISHFLIRRIPYATNALG